MQEKPPRTDTATAALLGLSVFLIVFGLIWAIWTREGMMGGMMGHHNGSTAFPVGTSLLIIGTFLLVLTIVFIIVGRGQQAPSPPPQPDRVTYPEPQAQRESPDVSGEDMQKLAIRLLSGDERKMFRRIVDEGGEVLQKDLVAVGIFSKAKVTRLLDKLEGKGLVVRERYGTTNRVRVSKELGK